MQTIELVLVFSLCFSILSFFIFIALLWIFRKNIRAKWLRFKSKEYFFVSHIIMPNNQEIVGYYVLDSDNGFLVGKDRYNFSNKAVVNQKNTPHIFHFYKNPSPIIFGHVEQKIHFDSSNEELLLKQKLIRDLLSENNWLMIILIVTCFGCLLTIGVIIKVYGLLEKAEGKSK